MTSGILMDIAGVLYEGDHAIEGAPEALAKLRDTGVPVRFLTNSTRTPKRRIVSKLRSFGMDVDDAEVMTPAESACAWLNQKGHVPHLLVDPDLLEDFEAAPSSGPIAVVVGDAGSGFTYDRLNAAFRELAEGAPLLALAYNRVFQDSDGLLSLDAGAFVKALEFASDRKAKLLGKPSEQFFAAGAESMGLAQQDVFMIGDDAESDVAGAIQAGLRGAVHVKTGKYRAGDETRFQPAPSFVAANLDDAVSYVLERLD